MADDNRVLLQWTLHNIDNLTKQVHSCTAENSQLRRSLQTLTAHTSTPSASYPTTRTSNSRVSGPLPSARVRTGMQP